MSNWRELPAGRELDRVIAERLGYPAFTEPIPASELGHYKPGITELSWMRVKDIPIPVPHYSADANAALMLWDTLSARYTPRLVRMLQPPGFFYKSSIIDSEHPQGIHEIVDESADTPALAICRAWLAYKAQPKLSSLDEG